MVPTVWNQVEGAMAYTLGLPVLIIAQNGLRSEALLESKYDWNVQWVEVDENSLMTPAFGSVFKDWRSDIDSAEKVRAEKAKAEAQAPVAATPVDYSGRTIGQILKDLKPGQAWKVGLALFGLVSALVTYSYKQGMRDGARAAPRSAAVSGTRSP